LKLTKVDYVDQVLSYANAKTAQHANSADLLSQATQTNILNLLLSPIKSYLSLFTALSLPNYVPLLHSQTYPTRRAVAGEVARCIRRNSTKISTPENLEGVLEILKVLIKEGMQQPSGYPSVQAQRRSVETDETIEEQGWLARIVHLIYSENNDVQFKASAFSTKYLKYMQLTGVHLAPSNHLQGIF
jgi:vacuolar protein sorting-associated protein 35